MSRFYNKAVKKRFSVSVICMVTLLFIHRITATCTLCCIVRYSALVELCSVLSCPVGRYLTIRLRARVFYEQIVNEGAEPIAS